MFRPKLIFLKGVSTVTTPKATVHTSTRSLPSGWGWWWTVAAWLPGDTA
jgi:hypothetical protein